jgi:hypothetical protein
MAGRVIAAFRRFARIIPLARPRLQLWSGVMDWQLTRRRRARRAWAQAVGEATRIGLPFDLALARFWIGRSTGGEEGASLLREALQALDRMPAAWHAAQARQWLERLP